MDRKSIIKAVIITFSIILGFILIEVALRGLASVTETIKTRNQIKKEEKEYQQTEEYQIETQIDSIVQTAVEMIQNKDYEGLFSHIDPMYKDFMQLDSIEKFKDYLDDYLGYPTSASLLSYKKRQDKYVCKVSISSESKSSTYTILIKPIEDSDFNIIFDNLLYIEDVTDEYTSSCTYASCNLIYRVVSSYGISYLAEIKNLSKSTIDGSFSNSILTKSNHAQHKVVNDLSSVKIEPGDTARIRLDFDDSSSNLYEEMFLDINYKGKNNDSFNMSVILEEMY